MPNKLTRLILTLLTALIILTCMSHYCWFRWEMETKRVQLLEHEVQDSWYLLEMSRLYYEAELEKLQPGGIPPSDEFVEFGDNPDVEDVE